MTTRRRFIDSDRLEAEASRRHTRNLKREILLSLPIIAFMIGIVVTCLIIELGGG